MSKFVKSNILTDFRLSSAAFARFRPTSDKNVPRQNIVIFKNLDLCGRRRRGGPSSRRPQPRRLEGPRGGGDGRTK